MNRASVLLLISLFLISCGEGKEAKESITLFAASSLTNVAYSIAENYEKETGVKVKLNVASSGILARQIESGAEFDYYISANKNWMDYVDNLNLVESSTIKTLANNRLVAIVPTDNDQSYGMEEVEHNFPNLFKGRLSIGDSNHVPAGKYAVQAIKSYGWEQSLNNRYLPAKNARDALLMVELGEAEMGIVYETDALKSDKVRIVYRFFEEACESIDYIGAAKKKRSENLNSFLLYLQSEDVRNIWKTNGFKLN